MHIDRDGRCAREYAGHSCSYNGGNHMKKAPAIGWEDVDKTTQPERFAQYLDSVKAVGASLAYKHQTFDLLAVERGYHILDVGCGTGEDVVALAQLVGNTGRVVGVDNSETMIQEAKTRTTELDLPVEYYVGDAHALDFADNTFNRCRADRTFQYLKDPVKALTEIMRVARSNAAIVISEPDWETLVVDADPVITRKILNYGCDTTPNGWIGRQLPALFAKAGLVSITVVPITFVLTDFAAADNVFQLQRMATGAHQSGVVSASEAATWLKTLEKVSQAGQFFSAVMGFIIKGQKP